MGIHKGIESFRRVLVKRHRHMIARAGDAGHHDIEFAKGLDCRIDDSLGTFVLRRICRHKTDICLRRPLLQSGNRSGPTFFITPVEHDPRHSRLRQLRTNLEADA